MTDYLGTMVKSTKLIAFLQLLCVPLFSQLTGFLDDFEDGSVDTLWNASEHTLWIADHPGTFGITESEGYLNLAYTRTAESWEWDNFNFTPPEMINVSATPFITLKIKSDITTAFSVNPIYSNGNERRVEKTIPGDTSWHSYSFELLESNYSGGLLQKIYLYLDGGSNEVKSGMVQFDDFQIAGFSINVFNLKADLIDTSKIDLTWETDDLQNTDHFNIYRSFDMGFMAGEETKIGETTDTVFHDSLLTNHTTYYYQVSATDTNSKEHTPANVSKRTSTPGAIPQIEIISENADPVDKYGKFEVLVEMTDATYDNPFNPEAINLYAWFYSPDGDSVKMNGFYDNYMGRDEWKIRFAANQPGSWEYQIFASDLDGTGESEKQSFSVVESANKGWLTISPDNSNYLMHDDGTSFYGISVYYPWNVNESRLDDFAAVSGNFFGYWDCTYDNAGNGGGKYLLESMESGVGRYDQRKAARIDEVLSWAEARDMKVMLAIWAHGYLRIDGIPWDNGNWYEHNPYSKIVDVEDFYTDSLSLSYQEKHYRYMIARWGYSQALGTWEIINEMHGTTGWVESQANSKKWVETVHAYFKENDPFKRPTTASFGGGEGASHYTETDQLGDMPNVHFYEQHGWPTLYPGNIVRSGLANVVNEARKLKSKGDRPAFFGEAGWDHMLAAPETGAYTWEFHNSFWAGLTNGFASTPFWWEFNSTDIFTQVRMQDYRILNKFVSDIDFAHQAFAPSEIYAENIDGYFMGADTAGFGWMKTYNSTSVSDAPIYISDTELNNGTYLLEWFNTWTGEIIDADTAICVAGITWGDVTADIDKEDIAFKICKLEDGSSDSTVNLFLIRSDTLLPGKWPWSPKIDSTIFSIVCYVTDEQKRLDVTFNGPVDIDIDYNVEENPDQFTVDLQQGGVVFDYQPGSSSGATVTATIEGLDDAVLYIPGSTGISDNENPNDLGYFELRDNYPNPFSRSTTIEYGLFKSTHIKLAIYNAQGELLEVLVDNQKPAGQHSIVWHADPYPAGIYFYTIVGEQFSISRKCVLIK